jgi:DNA-binding NarL/FixJ family response regulator
MTARQVAAELGISRATVRSHLRAAGRKLRADRAPGIVGAAIRAGLATPEPDTDAGHLDPWERHLVALLAEGNTEKAIAKETGKSANTIHNELEAARGRVGAATQSALVWRAAAIGAYPEPSLAGEA